MAIVRTIRVGLCLNFVYILCLSTVLSVNDAHNYYDADPSGIYAGKPLITLLDQNESHERLVKRQVATDQKKDETIYDNRSNPATNETKISKIDKSKLKDPMKVYTSTKDAPPKTLPPASSTTPIPAINVTKLAETPPVAMSSPAVEQANDTANNVTDEDIEITKFTWNENLNHTLTHLNLTNSRIDSHLYYNSLTKNDPVLAEYYWVNMTNRSDVQINPLLSKSHRRAATVKLSFEFPFYGHPMKSVTIATGGFIFMGDYVHSWLAATQYIAPLMANFDSSLSNDSLIRFVDNGTAFTVEWHRVRLQDRPNDGAFTFQTTLLSNGDIVFVYKDLPPLVENINDEEHPVKIGLSDAYIIDKTIFFVRKKTIYEYHRVNFIRKNIKNDTVIYLTALPTCLDSKDCNTCLTKVLPNFNCTWCPSVNRCSNGLDRNRQNWLTRNCEKHQFDNVSLCAHITASDIFDNSDKTYGHDSREFANAKLRIVPSTLGVNVSPASHELDDGTSIDNQSMQMGVSGIVAILTLICMISGIVVWVLYAYRNPHTTSGQILIRYRPSQWRWSRGEARYTAATIHM